MRDINTDDDVVFLNAPNRSYIQGKNYITAMGDVYSNIEYQLSHPINKPDYFGIFVSGFVLLSLAVIFTLTCLIMVVSLTGLGEGTRLDVGLETNILEGVIVVPVTLIYLSIVVIVIWNYLQKFRAILSPRRAMWYVIGRGTHTVGKVVDVYPDGTIAYVYFSDYVGKEVRSDGLVRLTRWESPPHGNERLFTTSSPVIVEPGDKVWVVHMRLLHHDLSVLL